jgi:hypothetical protein
MKINIITTTDLSESVIKTSGDYMLIKRLKFGSYNRWRNQYIIRKKTFGCTSYIVDSFGSSKFATLRFNELTRIPHELSLQP